MQETGVWAEQAPAPLQVLAGMRDAPSAEQPAAPQSTGVCGEQVPAPLHMLAGMRDNPSAEQAAAPQRTGVCGEQTPMPLHMLAGMRDRESAEQPAAPQGTAAGRVHMPVPLQVPAAILDVASIEQLGAPHASPAWVSQAVPFARHCAVIPHACSAQVVAQQTLFVPTPVATQLPLAQSPAAVHPDPSASGAWHWPPMQVKPAAQAAGLFVQLVAHTPPAHR